MKKFKKSEEFKRLQKGYNPELFVEVCEMENFCFPYYFFSFKSQSSNFPNISSFVFAPSLLKICLIYFFTVSSETLYFFASFEILYSSTIISEIGNIL